VMALSTHDMTLLVDERSLLVHGRALLVVDRQSHHTSQAPHNVVRPLIYQKRPLIYQKSHIVCRKSPITHPKHHTTRCVPYLHPTSSAFVPKEHYISIKMALSTIHLGKEQPLKFWLKAELPSMGSQFSVEKALYFREKRRSFLQSPTFPFEIALSTSRNRVAVKSSCLYGMIQSHM